MDSIVKNLMMDINILRWFLWIACEEEEIWDAEDECEMQKRSAVRQRWN